MNDPNVTVASLQNGRFYTIHIMKHSLSLTLTQAEAHELSRALTDALPTDEA